MPELVASQIDKYPVIRKLGEGGMGLVYLCRDATGREVAIKTLKPGLPDNVKRRFKEEGNRADLIHENIVTIYTVSEEEVDPPYIVMEYLAGDALSVLIKAGNRLTMAEKLDAIGQVCKGLDYAHSKGVIHRDIKPENIIRIRDTGRIKIVDFGISKVKRELDTAGLSQTQGIVGTVGYIAPERWMSRLEDGRVDIFSTGVMLYFLLTGREPFVQTEGEGPGPIMHRILAEPFPPLSLYLRDFPEGLTNVLERALAKDPSERYYTGMEFADDLALLTDELNRRRVPELLEEAERHLAEGDWQQARRRCQEALRIEPRNSDAIRLRDDADDLRKTQDVQMRLQRYLADAEEALETRRYDDAIRFLQEVDRLRPGTPQYQEKLQAARDTKRVQDEVEDLIRRAGMDEHAGDLTGPYQLYQQANLLAPNNPVVLREIDRLSRKIEDEEGRKRNERHIFNAEQKIAARQFTEALEILDGVRRSRIGHEKLDKLYLEASEGRGKKEASRLKEQVETQATKLRYAKQYEEALAELDRGLAALKGDADLFRLYQDVKAEFEEHERNKWIEETLEAVREQSLASIDGALATLAEAMRKLPGVARFTTFETQLLKRKADEGNELERAACLREAGEELSAGRPERAIQVIEAYLLKSPGDPDVDGLLQMARRALDQQRLRRRIAECAASGRALLDQGRFDEALGVLEPVLNETRDPELAELHGRAAKGKADVDDEVRRLVRRITELRQNRRLAEAVALIERQDVRTLNSPAMQEILAALRNELARDQALGEAISRSRRAVEGGEWATAREPLDNIRRVYGEFGALAQAVAEFESVGTRAADRSVGASIESAKASILAGDKKAAIKALEATAGPAAFASAPVLQEQKRLAKALKVDPPRPGPVIVTKRSGIPGWAIGVAALVVVVIGILVWSPWSVKEASVVVSFDPSEATVLVNGYPAQQTDQSGKATLKVKPGDYTLTVSKTGYGKFLRTFKAVAGGTNDFQGTLTDTRTAGYLVVDSGDVPEFEVFAGANSLGTKHKGEKIEIPPGTPVVHYAAEGYEPSKGKPILITKGQDSTDTWTPVRLSTAPKVDSFKVSQASVASGDQVTLQWSTTNTQKVSLEAVENGKSRVVGDNLGPTAKTSVAVTADTRFRLVATGNDGTLARSDEKLVSILRPGTPTILSFDLNKDTANAGETIELRWTANKDTTEVKIDPIGNRGASGPASYTIPERAAAPITFSITPLGKGGVVGTTVPKTVAVVPKAAPLPLITSFSPDRSSVPAGQSVVLQWSTKDAASVSIDGIEVAPQGSRTVPIEKTTIFALIARNADGKDARSTVTVSVTAAPAQPRDATNASATPTVDKSVLESAVVSFGNRITSALGKDEKGCKAALGSLSGMVSPGLKVPLESLGRRCGDVRTVTVAPPSCSSPKPSGPDHTAMVCEFAFPLSPKSGDQVANRYAGSNFVFAKSASGAWAVEKWEWPAH